MASVPDEEQSPGRVDGENRDRRQEEQVVPDGRSQPRDVRWDSHPTHPMAKAALREQDGVNTIPREGGTMAELNIDGIHHLRLTVTDVQRSREFYTGLLGFQVAAESPPADDPAADEVFKILFGGVVLSRGNLVMGLRPMAPAGDRFHPDRVGLDHLSFGVASRDELEQAVQLFDERGVTHGVITRLAGFGIDVLPFDDPDGIQLELTAPVAP
jgi:glyoxylase I family protein